MQAPQHLGKAVLLMVSDNVGSITMLHALAGGVLHIMFTLSFLLDNKVRFESFIRRVLHPGYKNYIGFYRTPSVHDRYSILWSSSHLGSCPLLVFHLGI